MPDLICPTPGCPSQGQDVFVPPEVDTSSVICGGCGTVLVGNDSDFDWEAEKAEMARQERIAKEAEERIQAIIAENERQYREAVEQAAARLVAEQQSREN